MVLPSFARLVLAGAAVAVVALTGAPAQAAGPGATLPVDVPAGFGPLPAAGLQDVQLTRGRRQLSDDGRFAVFSSGSDGLLPPAGDGFVHVFRRDLLTGDTTVVDRADGATGAIGQADAFAPVVSTDGHTVAFLSDAALDPADTNGQTDVYVRDLDAGTTRLVSRGDGAAGALADAPAAQPFISGDGTRVAWDSTATTLVAGAPAQRNVYVRILAAGRTLLGARGPDGAPANGATSNAVLDGTGRVAAFESSATNLTADDTDPGSDIVVRDYVTGDNTLVSRATGPAGARGDGAAADPTISLDGRRIAFSSTAANLGDGDGDVTTDIHLRDLDTATTTLISRADGATGTKASTFAFGPAISSDGTAVAFTSAAPSLSVDLLPAVGQTWVRHPGSGRTVLASRADGVEGAPADAEAAASSLNGDGSCVLLRTSAPSFGAPPVLVPSRNRAFVRVLGRECPMVAPQTTIDSGPDADVALGLPVVFSFTADEPGSTFACRVDEAPFAPCVSQRTVIADTVGTHTFAVRATDPAGLTDATPATRAFTVVDPPPVIASASLTNRTFKVAKRPTALTARRILSGTTIRWTLSKTATVTLAVRSLTTGRLVDGRCRLATPALRYRLPCPHKRAVGTLQRASSRGGSAVNFSGRIGRRALAAGRYDVTLRAVDRAGQASAPRTLTFRIAR